MCFVLALAESQLLCRSLDFSSVVIRACLANMNMQCFDKLFDMCADVGGDCSNFTQGHTGHEVAAAD